MATTQQMDMFLDMPIVAEDRKTTAASAPEVEAVSTLDRSPRRDMTDTSIRTNAAIEDAGDELVANRRNRVRTALRWSDIENVNDTLKVKETTKAKVWPKPDYAAMIATGMQPIIAHIYKQVYDSVAATPNTRTLNDDTLKRYIASLNRIESGLNAWTQDHDKLRAWLAKQTISASAFAGRPTMLTDLMASATLLATVYPDGFRNYQDEVRIAGGNKVLNALQPDIGEIKKAIAAIDQNWPHKRESWEVQGLRVLERPDVVIEQTGFKEATRYSVFVDKAFHKSFESPEKAEEERDTIRPFVLIGKRHQVLSSHDSREEAVTAARNEVNASKRRGVVSEKGISVVSSERVGVSRRMEGEDISSEQLMETFGFKGVNFGNWMKTPAARAEAQLHLNHAFDAFHDLAEVLHLPSKAMGLGGMLGVAFGAQGRGGAFAAHFVPGVNEINLTRTAGAGALAHEWAHAVDHHFARQAGLGMSTAPFLSEHIHLNPVRVRHEQIDGRQVKTEMARFGDVRPEILGAFRTVTNVMTERQQTPSEVVEKLQTQITKLEKNVEGWLRRIRGDFVGLEDKFDVLAEQIRTGDFRTGLVALGSNTHVYPVIGEMRDLYKTKHGRVYPRDPLNGLQSNVQALRHARERAVSLQDGGDIETSKVATTYLSNARALDAERGKLAKVYWSTKCELFARAFDSFVAEELEQKNALNSYLSHGVRETETVPVGEEREAVHAAFRSLVGEFKTHESEVGPVLFSTATGSPPKSMPLDDITAEVNHIRGRWPNMPPVTVVTSPSDLPFAAPLHTEGAHHNGRVYLVANNIADIQQLQRVMAHECVLHHGLEEVLGDYGFSKLHYGLQSLKSKGDPTVVALAKDIRNRYGELPPEIETKEIIAAAGEKCLDERGEFRTGFGFMKQVFAEVMSWLRDHGIPVKLTNTELAGLMFKAQNRIKQEPAIESVRPTVSEGRFLGKILAVTHGLVTQRIGRDDRVVVHDRAKLSGDVSIGDIADIHYTAGRGHVRAPSHAQCLGR